MDNNQPEKQLFHKPLGLFFALLVLILIGLNIVFYTVYYVNRQTKQTEQAALVPTIAPAELALSLDNPSDQSIINENLVTVSGKTKPETAVVFFTETDSSSVVSDSIGNFSGEIKLEPGINSLTVTAFGENGDEKSINMDLVYDQENVQGAKTDKSQSANPTSLQNKSQATIGQVENLMTGSMVIQNPKTKKPITIMIDKDTMILDKTNKKIPVSEFKLKDQVAVISSESGTVNKQIKALKVFMREATESAQIRIRKRHAVQGVITAIAGDVITLSHQIQGQRLFTVLKTDDTIIKIKNIVDATIADLAVGQRIIAVGDLNENNYIEARLIHLIPGKATGVFNKQKEATPTATIQPSPTEIPLVNP